MDQQKIDKILEILNKAREENKWGGGEDENGRLMPAEVDWHRLKTDILYELIPEDENKKRVCENCDFCQGHCGEINWYQCRRNPPILDGQIWRFAEVLPDWWCGEFKEKGK